MARSADRVLAVENLNVIPFSVISRTLIFLAAGCSLCGAEVPYLITRYGALPDGVTLSTGSIQKAIDDAALAGGGEVRIPAGKFRSGSIFLKPGVSLHLEKGAVLLGSENIEDYPTRETRIEGHFTPWRMALVNASGMNQVKIGGEGRIDGNGLVYWKQFWQRRKENPKCTNLEVERPRLMFIDRCSDVSISGLEFRDSGFWNLHLYRCQDVKVDGLDIRAEVHDGVKGPSTDGIDIDSSQRVHIVRTFISVNDDNIALKGSKGPLADKDENSPPVEEIRVEGCTFGDGNGMITCGSEATHIRNITVRNCRIIGNATLLTLKLRPDTPQHYRDILIDGIELSGTGRILHVAPWRQFFNLGDHAPPQRTVENVVIRNVSGSFRTMGSLGGGEGDTLRGIRLENLDLKLQDEKFVLGEVEGFSAENVKVNGKPFQVPAENKQ